MSKKKSLLEKLLRKPIPKNFTTKELDSLMSKCGCTKYPGGRGSSIAYCHNQTKRVVTFDGPHPEKELYGYQIKMIIAFLEEVGEI